jgi:hypothetical protein
MQMTQSPLIIPTLLAALVLASCREAQVPLPPAEPAAQAPAAVVVEPEATPPSTGEFPAMAAVCNIESIDNQSGAVLDSPVRVSAGTTVSGWRTLGTGEAAMAPAWLRATGADGSVAFQAFVPGTEDRPDVAELHGNPAALRSGFRDVAIEGLQPGTYTLEIILGSGDGFIRCAHARTLVVE